MQPERIEELHLSPTDRAQIATLLADSFDVDFGGRSFYVQPHHLRMVHRDVTIVGHLGLNFRLIRLGDRLVPVLGIGDVATARSHRGQGVASGLLRAAIDEGRRSPAELMLLFGDAGLYRGHGFRAVTNPVRHQRLDGHVSGDSVLSGDEMLKVLELKTGSWDDHATVDILGFKF